MQSAPLVYLHEDSQAKGLNVAHLLTTLLPTPSSRPPIVINNTQPTCANKRGLETQRRREPEDTIEKCITDPTLQDRIVIFRDLQIEETGRGAAEIATRRSGRVFIPVFLKHDTTTSDTSATQNPTAKADAKPEEIAIMERESDCSEEESKELVLNVAGMSGEEAAGKVARWVWWVGEFMSWDSGSEGSGCA